MVCCLCNVMRCRRYWDVSARCFEWQGKIILLVVGYWVRGTCVFSTPYRWLLLLVVGELRVGCWRVCVVHTAEL